jgi:phosphoglycolate phosphatase-like HAD superfamily hydrolase
MSQDFDTTGLLAPQKSHAQGITEALERLPRGYVVLDRSATGTGKTYSACAALRHLKRKFIVICPKLAIPQWKRVLEEFGLKPEFIINPEKLSRGNTAYYKRITAATYRKMYGLADTVEIPLFMQAAWYIPLDWVVLIDESHKMKGVDSQNAGILFNTSTQGYTCLCLSATQACTPLDMRAFGYATGLHSRQNSTDRFQLREFKKFAEQAGAKWVGKWGAQYFDSSDPESMVRIQAVHKWLTEVKKCCFRLTRKDFGDIFPPTQVVAEAYDMGVASDKIAEVYNEMETELDLLERRCENYKEHILAIITKARRHAELLKVPTIVEMLGDYNAEGRSGVVFVNYTDTIDAIIKRLSEQFDPKLIGRIDGGQSFKQRKLDMDDFNADRKHFMVCNLAAGGQSINLHDLLGNRPRSSIINPSYSAICVIQSAGRIDRAYAQSDVYQRFLFAARTIEEQVCMRFNDKNCFVTALNDGTLTDADLIPTEKLFRFAKGMTGLIK